MGVLPLLFGMLPHLIGDTTLLLSLITLLITDDTLLVGYLLHLRIDTLHDSGLLLLQGELCQPVFQFHDLSLLLGILSVHLPCRVSGSEKG